MHVVRRGAWRGSAWPVRYYPAYPRPTAATRPARSASGAVPRQSYLPIPVASLRNVTEKSALGVTRHQRHFRYSTGIRQRCTGRGVDQLVGHDAAPLLHPPLQRTQVRSAETIRFRILQPAQQCHRAGVRIFLQPPQHVAPHTFEGIGPCSPGVRRSRPQFSCDLLMLLTPAVGQLGQKSFQALASRCRPEFRGHERRQRRLGFPDCVQQRHWVQCGSAFAECSLGLGR